MTAVPAMKRLFGKKSSSEPTTTDGPQPQPQQPQPHEQMLLAHSAQYATSTIGYLCATGVDDWARMLELCEGASSSSKVAEETASYLLTPLEGF
jgi:hypothetical protein